jgi:spermidine synthase
MRSWRAVGLVFGSSAAVLMLEILAGRLMAPYVGVSLETFTGIIGTVLAGIAVGSAVGGSIADRRDPRPLIGPALVIGGALTWASLPILRLLGPGVGSGPVAIVVLTAMAFLAPATVLSAVAPMVAKLRLSTLDETGSVVGGLSAAGTVGAIAGTFLTGFVLVAAVPSRPAVVVIGAVLVASGVLVSWRLGRALAVSTMAFALVAAGAGALLLPPPCERETAYFCVNVQVDDERPSGRSLILDRVRHAYVDLEDPTHLELRYVRLIAAVADSTSEGPLRALHLGGGGFTYPTYLSETRPGTEQVVLEIDPALEEIAREELGFDPTPATDVRIGDARLALDELRADRFDLVVGDAFASTSVPWHLTTAEVMDELQRLMAPDGVYVMNVVDGGDSGYARAQLATLRDRFRDVVAILPSDGVPRDRSVNQILVASDAPLGELDVLPSDGRVVRGDELDEYVGDAAVLTDDHAPVDQLLLR